MSQYEDALGKFRTGVTSAFLSGVKYPDNTGGISEDLLDGAVTTNKNATKSAAHTAVEGLVNNLANINHTNEGTDTDPTEDTNEPRKFAAGKDVAITKFNADYGSLSPYSGTYTWIDAAPKRIGGNATITDPNFATNWKTRLYQGLHSYLYAKYHGSDYAYGGSDYPASSNDTEYALKNPEVEAETLALIRTNEPTHYYDGTDTDNNSDFDPDVVVPPDTKLYFPSDSGGIANPLRVHNLSDQYLLVQPGTITSIPCSTGSNGFQRGRFEIKRTNAVKTAPWPWICWFSTTPGDRTQLETLLNTRNSAIWPRGNRTNQGTVGAGQVWAMYLHHQYQVGSRMFRTWATYDIKDKNGDLHPYWLYARLEPSTKYYLNFMAWDYLDDGSGTSVQHEIIPGQEFKEGTRPNNNFYKRTQGYNFITKLGQNSNALRTNDTVKEKNDHILMHDVNLTEDALLSPSITSEGFGTQPYVGQFTSAQGKCSYIPIETEGKTGTAWRVVLEADAALNGGTFTDPFMGMWISETPGDAPIGTGKKAHMATSMMGNYGVVTYSILDEANVKHVKREDETAGATDSGATAGGYEVMTAKEISTAGGLVQTFFLGTSTNNRVMCVKIVTPSATTDRKSFRLDLDIDGATFGGTSNLHWVSVNPNGSLSDFVSGHGAISRYTSGTSNFTFYGTSTGDSTSDVLLQNNSIQLDMGKTYYINIINATDVSSSNALGTITAATGASVGRHRFTAVWGVLNEGALQSSAALSRSSFHDYELIAGRRYYLNMMHLEVGTGHNYAKYGKNYFLYIPYNRLDASEGPEVFSLMHWTDNGLYDDGFPVSGNAGQFISLSTNNPVIQHHPLRGIKYADRLAGRSQGSAT